MYNFQTVTGIMCLYSTWIQKVKLSCSSYIYAAFLFTHTSWDRKWSKGKWAALTSHLFPDPGRSQRLVAAERTMAGNWERSEGVPVGRTMLKTRATTRLVQVDTGPSPWPVGTGLFKTVISLLFEMFWRVWFQMSDVWRVGCLRCSAISLEN